MKKEMKDVKEKLENTLKVLGITGANNDDRKKAKSDAELRKHDSMPVPECFS